MKLDFIFLMFWEFAEVQSTRKNGTNINQFNKMNNNNRFHPQYDQSRQNYNNQQFFNNSEMQNWREYRTYRNTPENMNLKKFNLQNNQSSQNYNNQPFFTNNNYMQPVRESGMNINRANSVDNNINYFQDDQLDQNEDFKISFPNNIATKPLEEIGSEINEVENLVDITRNFCQNDQSGENNMIKHSFTEKTTIQQEIECVPNMKLLENVSTTIALPQNDQSRERIIIPQPFMNNTEKNPMQERGVDKNNPDNISTSRYHPYYEQSSEKSSERRSITNNRSDIQPKGYQDDISYDKYEYEYYFRYYQRYYNFTRSDYDRFLAQHNGQNNPYTKGSGGVPKSSQDPDPSNGLYHRRSRPPPPVTQVPGIYDWSKYTSKSDIQLFHRRGDKTPPPLNQNTNITSWKKNNSSRKNDMVLNYYKLQYSRTQDSNKNMQKKIYNVKMKKEIKKELENIWSKYIIHELKKNYSGLLEYLNFCRSINNGWKKMDDDCEMFYDDIKHEIEFHTSARFHDIKIYRRKFLNEKFEFCDNYLVVKGKPEQKFKKMYWDEDNIFIMDSKIGTNVYIKGNTYIGPNCKIGDNVTIYNNCLLKRNVEIENFTFIDQSNFIRKGCKIGVLDEKNNFVNDPNAVTEKNKIIKPLTQHNSDFKTIVGQFNFIGDDIIFPNEFTYGNDFIYSYE